MGAHHVMRDLAGFDLEGGRQQLRGDTLIITRETLSRPAGYALPYRNGGDVAQELESTPLIQSNDARIRETAQRIANGATDPVVVAQRLNEWVYDELDKNVARLMRDQPAAQSA